MSQDRTGSEPTAASLVGSLSSFPLVDVLELLARTGRTGELQVVGQGLDRRLWVDGGELVDTTGSGNPDTGLFEMACIEDGWFYFTLADSTPEGSGRASIPTVLEGLSSQVTEWRDLVEAFPFDAMVHMSSSTPADEVQIRADQWQLLTLVGAGREVHDVLSASSLHPLDTLRTLRELERGQLVWVEAPSGDGETADDSQSPPAGNRDQTNGSAPTATAEPPADAKQDSVPAAPDGAAATPNGTAGDGTPPTDGAEKKAALEQLQGPVMPPPISGDPWSSSLATPAANETQSADDRS